MITTLLAKELRHHRRTGLVTIVLSVAFLSSLVTYFVLRDTSSLLQIGAVAARLLAPVYAVLAARRLFVLERKDGTWQLLASLPVAPARVVALKLLVGAVFTVGLSVSYLLLLALLIHRRELIATEWLLMMIAQVGAYALAWFGIAALFAQLGRHRVVAWGALIVGFAVLADYDERLLRQLTWLDAVWLPIDHTRFSPPITATVRAALWGVGTGLLAVVTARLEDGLTVQRWYRPMTGRQRSMSIAWIVGLSTALTLVTTGVKKTPNYDPLPLVGRVRVAGSPGSPLHQLARALDLELTALQETLDVGDWPTIVILHEQTKQPDRVVAANRAGQIIELYVDETASPHAMLRQSLRRLLVARTGYLAQANESQAWIANGFAEAWLRRRKRPSPTFEARAGWASHRNVTTEELRKWWDLDLRLGQEVADAVAWVGLEVVASHAGEDAMFALAREVLGGWTPNNGVGLVRRRMIYGDGLLERHAGRPWAEHAEAWVRALSAFEQDAPNATVGGTVMRVSTASAAVALSWSRASTTAEQLWYARMPALSAVPNPAGDYEYVDLDAQGGIKSVEHDERARVVVTFARRVPRLDAWIIDGWREVEPR